MKTLLGFLFFAFLLFNQIESARKLRNKILQSDPLCPASLGDFAGFTLTTQSHYCHDSSFAMPNHNANIKFSAKNNDWYIGLFNKDGGMLYYLVFVGWSNTYTRLLYGPASGRDGVVQGCEAPMSLVSNVFYDYHVTLTPGVVVVRKDNNEAFRCNVDQGTFSQVTSYAFSCYCTLPSDTTVTFKDFETREANASDLEPTKTTCKRKSP
jgi:hypothetical protein